MLTNRSRASPSSEARSQRRLVVTSAPMTPFTTNTALSTTRSAASASALKLGSPGVSIRLILRSSQRNEERLAEIDISRAFSSAAESETVVPSATEPRRLIAPASNRSASFTDVLPLPRWPTNATLRILFGDSCAIRLPSLEVVRGARLLRKRLLQRFVNRSRGVHLGQLDHAPQRRAGRHHEPELLAPPRQPARDVEQHLDGGRVEIAAARDVEHERERVVRHRGEQLIAHIRRVRHVDLAAQPRHDVTAAAVQDDLGRRAHAARSWSIVRRMRMSVPPSARSTVTSSIRSSMMPRPRPRCSPRFSRQLPESRTVAVSSPESKATSTSKVASPGPYACSMALPAASQIVSVISYCSISVAPVACRKRARRLRSCASEPGSAGSVRLTVRSATGSGLTARSATSSPGSASPSTAPRTPSQSSFRSVPAAPAAAASCSRRVSSGASRRSTRPSV